MKNNFSRVYFFSTTLEDGAREISSSEVLMVFKADYIIFAKILGVLLIIYVATEQTADQNSNMYFCGLLRYLESISMMQHK